MKTVIFLGPSLPLAEAQAIYPGAIFRSPVEQSDVISVYHMIQPDVIGIIDGVFHQDLAVWHKEILYVLQKGVKVYGSSSMGALRAAEMDSFGMVGVGQVYQAFASGELNDDDEVALAHSDQETGFLNLSAPMVNIRATFRQAEEDGLLTAAQAAALIDAAKGIYYPQRTFDNIWQTAAAAALPADLLIALQQYVKTSYVDLKAQDARELLQLVRDLDFNPAQEREKMAEFLQDIPFRRFAMARNLKFRDRNVEREGIEIPLYNIVSFAALHMEDYEDFTFQALNRELVNIFASHFGVQVNQDEIQQEINRFCYKNEIQQADKFESWLADNDLNEEEFVALMKEVAVCRRMHNWVLSFQQNERAIHTRVGDMILQNQYAHWADEAARQEKVFRANFPDFSDGGFDYLTTEDLLIEHMKKTGFRISTHFMRWLVEAGFPKEKLVRSELIRAKVARDAKLDIAAEFSRLFGEMSPAGD